jgi:hypothetical protein
MSLLDRARSFFSGRQLAVEAAEVVPAEKAEGLSGPNPSPSAVTGPAVAQEIITPSRRTGISSISGTSLASRRQLLELYTRSHAMRRVVGKVAQDFASIEWHLYAIRTKRKPAGKAMADIARGHARAARKALKAARTSTEKGNIYKAIDASGQIERVEILDHPLLDIARGVFADDDEVGRLQILHGAPALAMWATYRIVLGEAFELLIPNGDGGVPGGVLCIPPHWIHELPAFGDRYFRAQIPGGGFWRIPAELMLYERTADVVDPHGRGTGAAVGVVDELELDRAAARAMRTFFSNDMRPQLVIVGPVGATPEKKDAFLDDWGRRLQGEHNRVKPHVINAPGGANAPSVHQLDVDFSGMRMAELRDQEHEIIRGIVPGVSGAVLGDFEDVNRATAFMSKKLYNDGTLEPLAGARRKQLMELASLYKSPAPLYLDYFLPEAIDEEARLERAKLAPWAVSIAEHAKAQGVEAVPGLEKIYMVPAGMSIKTEEQLLNPPKPLAPVAEPGGPADAFADDEDEDDE